MRTTSIHLCGRRCLHRRRLGIATNDDRVARGDALQKEVDALLGNRLAEDVVASREAAGVPGWPITLSDYREPRREAPPALGADQDRVFADYAPRHGVR
jgi:hypothetical protein